MNRRMPKLWQQAVSAALAIALVALVPLSSALADTKPYFRTINGGPFAGGWFGDSCSTSADYQSPYNVPAGDPPDYYKGAIMGFLDLGNGGASSNLDAFATGLIEGETVAPDEKYGFSTGLASEGPSPTGSRSLSFANVGPAIPDFWGGTLEGASGGEHCIPDYFGTKQTNIVGGLTGTLGTSDLDTSGQYTWGGGNISGTVAPDVKLILFVEGNVTITEDIIYGSNNLSTVPKFALVVKGNIYVGPNVTQLEGWYITQPRSDGSGGVIWTCSSGTEPLPDTYIRNNCNSKLTVNGAFTASQVNLSRIVGNISTGSSAEDVNFSAAMVLGGPFFEETSGGSGSSSAGAIQSLISLPPVF